MSPKVATPDGMKIFCGTANPELARAIAKSLKVPLGEILSSRFSEGEIRIKINEDVRGRDIFLIQPTCPPVNDNVMELLIILDAFRRASARRITAVLPYYGYARQDRKDQPRVPITAKLMANIITEAGADRVLTMDLHAQQIQGFFDIPVDHLYAFPVIASYIRKKKLKNLTIVSPDVGGIKMARAYAKGLNADLAIVDKRRTGPNEVEAMNLIGEVKGRTVLIPDDMIATAGSLVEAVNALVKFGAADIYASCTHAILSGNAVEKIKKSVLKEVVVTDTIPIPQEKRIDKITVLPVAPLFGEAILRIHNEESISSLFNDVI
ncbi:MAG TPA: ribose-phosphate pyrophosphokinase [bacterium]|nr:ribose-phosphate pyrophosphokinase [bacterium]